MPQFDTALPRQLVIFRVAETQYGLDIDEVQEILPPTLITVLSGAPGGVLGLLDVRGMAVPLFDLHWKFAVPSPEQSFDTRFVLVRTPEGPVALLVDAVDEVIACHAGEFQPVRTPGHTDGLGYLNGVYHHAEALVLWVEPERLVPVGVTKAVRAA